MFQIVAAVFADIPTPTKSLLAVCFLTLTVALLSGLGGQKEYHDLYQLGWAPLWESHLQTRGGRALESQRAANVVVGSIERAEPLPLGIPNVFLTDTKD
jgi:hypothetical protein